MSEIISNPDFLEVMEAAFAKGSTVCFTPSGASMLPLLNGTDDTVTLSEKPKELKKYDVVFYVREGGSFVLHRIVRQEKDGTFTLSGDNQYDLEKGVRYEDVRALMTACTHNGAEMSLSSFSYRLYVRWNVFKKYSMMTLLKVYRRLFRQ